MADGSSWLSNIGSWLKSPSTSAEGAAPMWETGLTGGLAGAGMIGNILQQKQQNAYNNFIMGILKNPAKLAEMVRAVQQPLSGALVQGVTNRVGADMASRGLAQAPGIFAGEEAQALAPAIQANQNAAMQAVLTALTGARPNYGTPSNTSGAIQTFLNTLGKPSSGTTPTGLTDWSMAPSPGSQNWPATTSDTTGVGIF